MRKASLMLLYLIILTQPAFAATQMEPKGTMMRKFQRGFINIGMSPIEISHELHKEKRTDAYLPSWVPGIFRGTTFMVGRALSGVYDLVTFPIPLPSGYEPLVYPELVTEHLEDTK
jgi:putative exosortase-associated protein (TIGR04073 family)